MKVHLRHTKYNNRINTHKTLPDQQLEMPITTVREANLFKRILKQILFSP